MTGWDNGYLSNGLHGNTYCTECVET